MENRVRFGPSGNSQIFYEAGNKKSTQAPAWLKSVGLDAYEYSFGRGYTMGEETAKEIGLEAEKNDVLVSVHAPYYINFANTSDEMVEKSYNYVLKGLQYLEWLRGKKIVVHAASQGKLDRQEALKLVRERITTLVALAKQQFDMSKYLICLETMGKYQQIGNEFEVVDLCTIDECLIPTFDFGHLNCIKQGAMQAEEDYRKVFDYAIANLGFERVKNIVKNADGSITIPEVLRPFMGGIETISA